MRKKQSFLSKSLSLGVCYYPEQWPETLWREDLRRMVESGVRFIRIGEFGWSKVEPQEGAFTFNFYDRFLDLVAETPLKVIFGTPTATPPAWLTERYPEVLNCRQDGVPYRHGMRRHYTYNSPVYQKLCARIVEQLARHYGQNPAIIGWQIDNELNCEMSDFYSESDTTAFRAFLRERYGTVDALNEAWGTVFWNQTYGSWEEVYVPRLTLQGSGNPHQALDYIRFVSWSAIHFCKLQSDILRKYSRPDVFITTNGMFPRLDSHRMTDEALDIFFYDSYPNFAYGLAPDPGIRDGLRDRRWSGYLSEVRSVCPHFGIMEQQSGPMGWTNCMESTAPKLGQMTLWAIQSIAHGADLVSFFRWRTALMGTEIYWHGVLDYDGHDNRRLAELKALAQRLETLAPLAGADYSAAFALVRDWDNVWDADVDVWHRRLAQSSEEEIFTASQLTHTPMDYCYLSDETEASELLRYPVLIYPHAFILSDRKARLLQEYVEQGGVLVLGAHTGMKDETGKCVMMPMPGILAELTHTTVEEHTFIGPLDRQVEMEWGSGRLPCGIFNDVLVAADSDARVLACYAGSWYAGKPALIERRFGKGRVIHFGGTFSEETTAALLKHLGIYAPWDGLISLPKACELCPREKDGKQYLFVLNYQSSAQQIVLHVPMRDMETSETVEGDVALAPYAVKVFRRTAD